jgi:cell division septal protein FtsQ
MHIRRRVKPVRRTRVLLFRSLFFFMIISLALYCFLQSSFWSIQTIIVEGNDFLSETEVLQLASIPLGLNIFKADVNQGREKYYFPSLGKKCERSPGNFPGLSE